MVRLPDDHPAWIDLMDPERVPLPLAGDPYFPGNFPIAPVDLSEEEDPSEDEEEDDPEEIEESDNEGILEDAQGDDDGPVEDEESLTDEEPALPTPPSSPLRPYYQPYHHHGKSPLLMRTQRMRVPPLSHLDTFTFVSRPIVGQKRKPTLSHEPAWLTDLLVKRRATDDPPRFETGESSQAPPHVPFGDKPEDDPIPRLMTQGDRLADRVQSLEELFRATGTTSRAIEQRVGRLEEEEKDDTEAIQTLYHRMGASRTEANTLSAHIRALEYRTQIAESRLNAAVNQAVVAEQRQRQLQEQFDELVHYFIIRLGW